MEEVRSLFIATDELYTSPMIQRYAHLFDVAISVGQTSLLSFVFPFKGNESLLHKTLIHYNPDLMDIHYASIYKNSNGKTATLTLSIEPRDVGLASLTISTAEEHTKEQMLAAFVPQVIKNKPVL